MIRYPECLSEFEVHATLWNALRAAGIDARGEVYMHGQTRGARFDIVVFRAGQAVVCIEVKRAGGQKIPRKLERYASESGVPQLCFRPDQDTDAFIHAISERFNLPLTSTFQKNL